MQTQQRIRRRPVGHRDAAFAALAVVVVVCVLMLAAYGSSILSSGVRGKNSNVVAWAARGAVDRKSELFAQPADPRSLLMAFSPPTQPASVSAAPTTPPATPASTPQQTPEATSPPQTPAAPSPPPTPAATSLAQSPAATSPPGTPAGTPLHEPAAREAASPAPTLDGARYVGSNDRYLMLHSGWLGVAVLPQVIVELGQLAAAVGRTLVEPCVADGAIVPCKCGAIVEDTPAAAVVGYGEELAKLAQSGDEALAAFSCAGTISDDETDAKLALPGKSHLLSGDKALPIGALIDWSTVSGATGANLAHWSYLCEHKRTAYWTPAPVNIKNSAYCGNPSGQCSVPIDPAAQARGADFYSNTWTALIGDGDDGNAVVSRLRADGGQVMLIADYVPGSIRVTSRIPAAGRAGNAGAAGGVVVQRRGPSNVDERSSLAGEGSVAVPFNSYHACAVAKWALRRFNGALLCAELDSTLVRTIAFQCFCTSCIPAVTCIVLFVADFRCLQASHSLRFTGRRATRRETTTPVAPIA